MKAGETKLYYNGKTLQIVLLETRNTNGGWLIRLESGMLVGPVREESLREDNRHQYKHIRPTTGQKKNVDDEILQEIDAGAGYPCWVCTNFECVRRTHKKKESTKCQVYDLSSYGYLLTCRLTGETPDDKTWSDLDEAYELTGE